MFTAVLKVIKAEKLKPIPYLPRFSVGLNTLLKSSSLGLCDTTYPWFSFYLSGFSESISFTEFSSMAHSLNAPHPGFSPWLTSFLLWALSSIPLVFTNLAHADDYQLLSVSELLASILYCSAPWTYHGPQTQCLHNWANHQFHQICSCDVLLLRWQQGSFTHIEK